MDNAFASWRKYVSLTLLVVGIFISLATIFLSPAPDASAGLDIEPTRKVEIIIQSNKVGATLTNFPVLLTKANIPDEACDADGTSPAQNGGGDIRFTSDENGNTQLALEVVDFTTANDPANCTVEMYVKVPSVSSASNTSIWMWYNTATTASQPAASSTYGSESVWDSNYKGVWHLDESSGTRNDSTANHNNLTDNNSVASAAAKWGTGADFEEDNSRYLSIADASQTGLDITGDLTMFVWTKVESAPSSNEVDTVAAKTDTGPDDLSYTLTYKDVSGTKKLAMDSSSTGACCTSKDTTHDLGTATWHHVGMVYRSSASSVEFYVDGTQTGSTQTGMASSLYNSAAPFILGAMDSPAVNYFDGVMKAARISATARSSSWISTEYNNQNDPGTFAIEQAPQVGSTAPESTTIVKSADQSDTNNSLDDDSHFSFNVKANTKYVINGGLFATSASAQPDIKIAFTVPIGTTMDIGYLAQGGNNRTAELLETSGTASAEIPIVANSNTLIQTFGSFTTGSTSGTLLLRWAQNTTNATATTLKQGSFLTVTEVTE